MNCSGSMLELDPGIFLPSTVSEISTKSTPLPRKHEIAISFIFDKLFYRLCAHIITWRGEFFVLGKQLGTTEGIEHSHIHIKESLRLDFITNDSL